MGNVLETERVQLNPVLESYRAENVKFSRVLLARFEKHHKGFGWGLDKQEFETIRGKLDANQKIDDEWKLWDDDDNGVADIREIATAVIIIGKGDVNAKITALFSLFSLDGDGRQGIDELLLLCRTTASAWAKVTSQTSAPTDETLQAVALNMYDARGSKQQKISLENFSQWIKSMEWALCILGHFGAPDFAAVKEAAVAKAAIQAQQGEDMGLGSKRARRQSRFAPLEKRGSSHIKAKGRPRRRSMSADRCASARSIGGIVNVDMLRAIKGVFDQIDDDGSGTISLAELQKTLGGSGAFDGLSIFKLVDMDSSGQISFQELLRVLFPDARPSLLSQMVEMVCIPMYTAEDGAELKDIFQTLDTAYTGKVALEDIIAQMEQSDNPKFKKWLMGRVHRFADSTRITLGQLICELFTGKNQVQRVTDILDITPEVGVLSQEQQGEIEELFRSYDENGDGVVTVEELSHQVSKLGFTQEDVNDLFTIYDINGDNTIDVEEFKRFYRQVWSGTPQNPLQEEEVWEEGGAPDID